MNCIIMKRGFDHRKNVGNPLINMYVNCGCLNETKLVSDRMILKDDISWGSIARGYVQHEDWQLALEIFRKMISEDIKLNTFILSSMSKACGSLKELCLGELVHFRVIYRLSNVIPLWEMLSSTCMRNVVGLSSYVIKSLGNIVP